MTDELPPGRWSRETRLLLLTVAVCALVLLVLARLRFPDAPIVEVSAPSFEQLAARASYDALAADIQRVARSILNDQRRVVVRYLPPEEGRAGDAIATSPTIQARALSIPQSEIQTFALAPEAQREAPPYAPRPSRKHLAEPGLLRGRS